LGNKWYSKCQHALKIVTMNGKIRIQDIYRQKIRTVTPKSGQLDSL